MKQRTGSQEETELTHNLHAVGGYFRQKHDIAHLSTVSWIDARVTSLAFGLLAYERPVDDRHYADIRKLYEFISKDAGRFALEGTVQLARLRLSPTMNGNFTIQASCPSAGFETTYRIERGIGSHGIDIRGFVGESDENITNRAYAIGRILTTVADAHQFMTEV